MEVEAPADEEMGGAGPGAAPAAPEQRRGLMGRFGRGKPAAAGRIEETPVHEAAPSTVYTGDESSIGGETDDFTESEYTESRVSGRR